MSTTHGCRVELMAGLRVIHSDRVITQFRTQKNSLLLAYLASFLAKSHSRELLTELLWPEAPNGRDNLNQSISTLRRILEPLPASAGTILQADRNFVRLNPHAVTTDISDFESAVDKALQSLDTDQLQRLTSAEELYKGELLPGYDAEWISAERIRLSEAYLRCLNALVKSCVYLLDYDRALHYALKALTVDYLNERTHRTLMRLYVASGRPGAAVQQFDDLVRAYRDAFGAMPSRGSCELAAQIGLKRVSDSGRGDTIIVPTTATKPPEKPTGQTHGSNLPLRFKRLIGREDELHQLTALLQPSSRSKLASASQSGDPPQPHRRIVTITGSGGTGKTTLAIEAARRVEAQYGDVRFMSMSDVNEFGAVLSIILRAIAPDRREGSNPLEFIVNEITGRSFLLIIDSIEHLLPEVGYTIESLRNLAPDLMMLVTSRRRIEVIGEQEFVLMPLTTPAEHDGIESLCNNPSVKLFVDRALAVRPEFCISAKNSKAVSALCRRLDGIPLAIELAAARSITLSPEQMLERLNSSFALLSTRRSAAAVADRHRSLNATMDWSYSLLQDHVKSFFTSLSIFQGSWSIEAAHYLLSGYSLGAEVQPSHDELEVETLNLLEELRLHSLIIAEQTDVGVRFRMLDTLRQYSKSRLTKGLIEDLARRHCDYMISVSSTIETGTSARPALISTSFEIDNFRSALQWSVENSDVTRALSLAQSYQIWHPWIPVIEGRNLIERTLRLAIDVKSVPRARTAEVAGVLATKQGDCTNAIRWLLESEAMFSEIGCPNMTSGVLLRLGHTANDVETKRRYYDLAASTLLMQGDRASYGWALCCIADIEEDVSKAIELAETSITILHETSSDPSWAIFKLSNFLLRANEHERAALAIEEGMACFRSTGSRLGVAWMQVNLARLEALRGNYSESILNIDEAIILFTKRSENGALAGALVEKSSVENQMGNNSEAIKLKLQALQLYCDMASVIDCSKLMEMLAPVVEFYGDHDNAVRILGAAAALKSAYLGKLDSNLNSPLFEMVKCDAQLWLEGHSLTCAEAVNLTLSALHQITSSSDLRME